MNQLVVKSQLAVVDKGSSISKKCTKTTNRECRCRDGFVLWEEDSSTCKCEVGFGLKHEGT